MTIMGGAIMPAPTPLPARQRPRRATAAPPQPFGIVDVASDSQHSPYATKSWADVMGYLRASELRFRAEVHLMARRIEGIRGGALTPFEYRSIVVNRVTKLAHRLLPDA